MQLLTSQVAGILALLQHVLDTIFEKSVLAPVRPRAHAPGLPLRANSVVCAHAGMPESLRHA